MLNMKSTWGGGDVVLPNVCICDDVESEVHYNMPVPEFVNVYIQLRNWFGDATMELYDSDHEKMMEYTAIADSIDNIEPVSIPYSVLFNAKYIWCTTYATGQITGDYVGYADDDCALYLNDDDIDDTYYHYVIEDLTSYIKNNNLYIIFYAYAEA